MLHSLPNLTIFFLPKRHMNILQQSLFWDIFHMLEVISKTHKLLMFSLNSQNWDFGILKEFFLYVNFVAYLSQWNILTRRLSRLSSKVKLMEKKSPLFNPIFKLIVKTTMTSVSNERDERVEKLFVNFWCLSAILFLISILVELWTFEFSLWYSDYIKCVCFTTKSTYVLPSVQTAKRWWSETVSLPERFGISNSECFCLRISFDKKINIFFACKDVKTFSLLYFFFFVSHITK